MALNVGDLHGSSAYGPVLLRIEDAKNGLFMRLAS
jgi:hypothetical protein